MDTLANLKNSLIAQIKRSNDLEFLRTLQTILDTNEQGPFQLSSEQAEAIEKGRQDIEDGNMTDNQKLFSDMKAWLAGK